MARQGSICLPRGAPVGLWKHFPHYLWRFETIIPAPTRRADPCLHTSVMFDTGRSLGRLPESRDTCSPCLPVTHFMHNTPGRSTSLSSFPSSMRTNWRTQFFCFKYCNLNKLWHLASPLHHHHLFSLLILALLHFFFLTHFDWELMSTKLAA